MIGKRALYNTGLMPPPKLVSTMNTPSTVKKPLVKGNNRFGNRGTEKCRKCRMLKRRVFFTVDVTNEFSVIFMIPVIFVRIARNLGVRAVRRHWHPSRQQPSFGALNENQWKMVITLRTTKESFGGDGNSLATNCKICRNYTRTLRLYRR
jgi:hypothetical protein